jgi:hypothetical protein
MKMIRVAVVLAASLLTPPSARVWADRPAPLSATEGIAIGGAVTNSTITNTINQQDPAILAAMAKTFAEQVAVATEARSKAEARASELATKLGFTSAAVTEFFKIVGKQNVPEEKIPALLIEIATHFAQTRDTLAALEPDDPHAAELARQAKEAFDSGRLLEAEAIGAKGRAGPVHERVNRTRMA